MTDHEGDPLAQLSDALADAVERAARSTVQVNGRGRLPASGVAWTADGAIVTADHVLERDDEITVGLPDGSDVAATLAGRDPGSDLAVLRIAADGLVPAEHASAGETRVGHLVLALGRPSAGGPQASFGTVSAIGGPWRTFRGGRVDGYLRPDVTFYPGFSGGPLIDVRGPRRRHQQLAAAPRRGAHDPERGRRRHRPRAARPGQDPPRLPRRREPARAPARRGRGEARRSGDRPADRQRGGR